MWFKRRRKTIFESLTDAYGGPFVCRVLATKGRYDRERFALRYQRSKLEYLVGHTHSGGYSVRIGAAVFPDRTNVSHEDDDDLVAYEDVRRALGAAAPPLARNLEDILAQLIALEPLLKARFLPAASPPRSDETPRPAAEAPVDGSAEATAKTT